VVNNTANAVNTVLGAGTRLTSTVASTASSAMSSVTGESGTKIGTTLNEGVNNLASGANNLANSFGNLIGGLLGDLTTGSHVKPGQTVLVHGGGGAIGSSAIQMLKHSGCRVLTTCASRHIDRCRGLGADIVKDYRTDDIRSFPTVDFILDASAGSGHEIEKVSIPLLRPGGRYVTLNTPLFSIIDSSSNIPLGITRGLGELAAKKANYYRSNQINYSWGYFNVHRNSLKQIADLMQSGVLRAFIDNRTFHLTDCSAAHGYLESQQNTGKIVLNHL